MVKLQTLKPRLAVVPLVRVSTITTDTQRMRGRRLQARNHRFLAEHPLCACCARQGRTTAAAEVDHKVPLHEGGQDVESNLQGLCIPCHKAKSAREASARAGGGGGQKSGAFGPETAQLPTQRKNSPSGVNQIG